jgi:hypothetical protein
LNIQKVPDSNLALSWDYGDNIYFHILQNGEPQGTGYKFWIGQIYDRETPIDKGAPW